jgi:outer membrane protein assembly factor BamA
MLRFFLHILLFLPVVPLPAQQLLLVIDSTAVNAVDITVREAKLRTEWTHPDTLSLPDSVAPVFLKNLHARSYLAASIDSLMVFDSIRYGRLYLGPAMYWVSLRPDTATLDLLQRYGFREKYFTGKPLRYDAVLRRQQALLSQAENGGYPFAIVVLDSIQMQPDGGVSARLVLDRGRFITFKGIKSVGNLRLPPAYLPAYLGIRPGIPYNGAKVQRVKDRIRELPFAELQGAPSLTFSGNEATLNLFLQKKKASRFDFIVGILPQPNTTDGRLLITGSLNAAFQNALNLGEHFSIDLERLRPETQELETAAGIPYLFGLPVGLEGRLNIFRRDSSWVDANTELGVQYRFEGGAFLKLLWETRNSSLQTIDTLSIINNRRLPAVLDLQQRGFGAETAFSQLDYRFNPRKGWTVQFKGVAGFTGIRRNSQIENLRDPNDPVFSFASLYDTVTQRRIRWRGELRAEAYLPILERSTVKFAVRSHVIFSEKPVFNNEQYRLGGNRLLRGFNEESLFATRFLVGTLEYRLLLGDNSFLSVFSDYGYLENITNRVRVFQRPWGIGAGLNFETKAGVFGVSLATGRYDSGLPFDWRAAKFHLGYVSLF